MLLMVEIPLLEDIIRILAVAVVVIMILQRFKIPTIIGFLICGVIAGPYALHLVNSDTEVEFLAEIGVVLLLFTIGLEFSIKSLMKVRKAIFLGGTLQVLLTILCFGAFTYFFGYDYLPIAIFMGFLFALSSTAIVLKVMQSTGEIHSRHGQVVLAILIFQDIIIVPMMLSVPILAGVAEDTGKEVIMLVLKLLGIGILLVLLAKYVIPRFLYEVAKTRSKDLFIVTIMVICFAIAWLTSLAGLSLALGAFLAGLVISETPYSHEATGYIIPFKEIFTSIFFISVGMLMDFNFFIAHLHEILILTLIVMVGKALMAGLAAAALRVPFRTILLVAVSICQVGEFSFVLAKTGSQFALLPVEIHQYFLAVAVTTMAITPILIKFDEKISDFILRKLPISEKLRKKLAGQPARTKALNVEEKSLEEHIIIIGFGPAGQNLAAGAKAVKIPYVIIEQNPETVKHFARKREPIIYGDASNDEVLHHAKLHAAQLVLMTPSTPEMGAHLAPIYKRNNPDVMIIARTPFKSQAPKLREAGVDAVIVDEVEANLEMIMRVMDFYDISTQDTYEFTAQFRTEAEEDMLLKA